MSGLDPGLFSQEHPNLPLSIGCPTCAGPLTLVNGTIAKSKEGVGTAAILVLNCGTHGAYDVNVQVRRSQTVPERHLMSGAAKRRQARERRGLSVAPS